MANFDWWKNALKGDFGPIHEGDPQPGFYRNASKKYGDYPVAIWHDDDEGMMAVKGFDERSCDADDIWTFVCRKPVEHDFYKAAIEAGKWPDEAPAPASMGDNIPDDPAEALQMELDGQMEGLEAFLDTPITEQAQADKAATWSKNMAEISKSADNQRKVEKQPSIDKGKVIDKKWNPIRDDAKTHSIDLKRHTDAWLLKQQHLERERQRIAHEEAERLRNEAAEAHRGANSNEAIEEASQKASDAEVVALPAPEQARHWTKILDLLPTATKNDIKIRYRAMAKQLHTNGAHESAFSELNVARDMALEDQ